MTGYVAALCQQIYADEVGCPSLPPGCYFRLLLIGFVVFASAAFNVIRLPKLLQRPA